jgi:hypothetical protein
MRVDMQHCTVTISSLFEIVSQQLKIKFTELYGYNVS